MGLVLILIIIFSLIISITIAGIIASIINPTGIRFNLAGLSVTLLAVLIGYLCFPHNVSIGTGRNLEQLVAVLILFSVSPALGMLSGTIYHVIKNKK